jgi:hypothetical protein
VADVAVKAAVLKNSRFNVFLKNISERLFWDEECGELHVRKPFRWHYHMTNKDSLVFLPSYFVWPHLFVDKIGQGILFTYDSSRARQEASARHPVDRIAVICEALGDHSRLRLLSLLQDRPLTTQALAQLCHLSEGTVSRHLQILKRARLITSRAEGKYVLYWCPLPLFDVLSQLVR